MADADRKNACQLCADAIARGEPLSWFDQLYANGDVATIPWANLEPNPNLVSWNSDSKFNFDGRLCLKVGCGLGDDCEYISSCGGVVTGFDISPTAIEWCQRRVPNSDVEYLVQNVLEVPQEWARKYEFVLESYTLQVLPPDIRQQAIAALADCVADDGTLLVICRARQEAAPKGQMPWPITRRELESFGNEGLTLIQLEEFRDNETPPVHRFRAEFQRV
jgi:SAM-dependent methyltransferase